MLVFKARCVPERKDAPCWAVDGFIADQVRPYEQKKLVDSKYQSSHRPSARHHGIEEGYWLRKNRAQAR
jgi:hypothetical protein